MGDRIGEIGAGLVMVGLMLTILVVLSGAFLVILILIFIFRVLLRRGAGGAGERGPTQRLGLFDAPASHWWVDRYYQWLFRLEDILDVNFSHTPARIFAGSMIFAGISGGILAGAGYWLVGLEAAWPILIVATLGNGLSAYWLSRLMTAMFEPFNNGGSGSLSRMSGVIIGEPLDWE